MMMMSISKLHQVDVGRGLYSGRVEVDGNIDEI